MNDAGIANVKIALVTAVPPVVNTAPETIKTVVLSAETAAFATVRKKRGDRTALV